MLDNTLKDFRPLVYVVNNYDRNYKVGEVKLLICIFNLLNQQDKPGARQLLNSLIKYADSDKINPSKYLERNFT